MQIETDDRRIIADLRRRKLYDKAKKAMAAASDVTILVHDHNDVLIFRHFAGSKTDSSTGWIRCRAPAAELAWRMGRVLFGDHPPTMH